MTITHRVRQARLAVFSAMLGALPLRAQTAIEPTGSISGRVITAVTEAPVADATVRVRGEEVSTRTDSAGRFVLRGVRTGIVSLEIRALGFAPVSRGDIAVSPAKPAEVTIVLRPVRAQLQSVLVRPAAFPRQLPPATPVSTQTYTAEEVRRQPGAQEDVLRAVRESVCR